MYNNSANWYARSERSNIYYVTQKIPSYVFFVSEYYKKKLCDCNTSVRVEQKRS